MQDKIEGLILPISKEILENLEKREKAIFFKFMPHQTIPEKLNVGSKLFFYLSKSGKIIVGEAKINRIELMIPKKTLEKYKSELLVKPSEFRKYVGSRINKNLLVLSIKDIKIYNQKVQLNYFVTMGGKYLSTKEYKSWRIKNQTF
jgi:hypothetical protein